MDERKSLPIGTLLIPQPESGNGIGIVLSEIPFKPNLSFDRYQNTILFWFPHQRNDTKTVIGSPWVKDIGEWILV